MPTRSSESPRAEHDRDPQSRARVLDEPRNFGQASSRIHTQDAAAHQGFDADLNPIDDELINTRGSER